MMMLMDKISLALLIIGGLNWGSVGLFDFDIVAWIFGSSNAIGARIVYTLVGLSAIWLIIVACLNRGKINVDPTDE